VTPPRSDLTHARVLLAEDDAASRDMLGRRLERRGLQVTSVADGAAALAALAAQPFDVILLDWMMPDVTGIEVLDKVRSQHMSVELPVIMITARGESSDMLQAFEHGANDYITKPVDFSVALARISVHVALARAREALQRSEQRYALAARGANDGLWDFDVAGDELYVSPRWCEMLGLPASEPTRGLDFWLERAHDKDRARVTQRLEEHLAGTTEHFECEYRMRHADGSFRWMLCRGLAVHGPSGVALRVAGSQTDVTARREAEERLRREALHDPLTGLYNRRQLLTELDAAVALARRHDLRLTVCVCDIDYFKQVNDRFGHATGDQVLSRFSEVLRASLRGGDIAGRPGGDEFCIIFPHTGPEDATVVSERIREAFADTVFTATDGAAFHVTATFGLATLGWEDGTAAHLLERADQSLYRAKQLGRNQISLAPPAPRT
jgi:diguanylate cyclase (GGDEF)-like protein/PAS domain S-box-containing protein